MSQTKPIGNEILAARRSEILAALLNRSERTQKRAYGTDDVGTVEQITFLRGTGKKGKRGTMYCGESVTLVCLEGDAEWQRLPGHRPSAEAKRRASEKLKAEAAEKARVRKAADAPSAASL